MYSHRKSVSNTTNIRSDVSSNCTPSLRSVCVCVCARSERDLHTDTENWLQPDLFNPSLPLPVPIHECKLVSDMYMSMREASVCGQILVRLRAPRKP